MRKIYTKKMCHLPRATLLCLVAVSTVPAQTTTENGAATLNQILERLDKLEKQNEQLTSEVKELRLALQAASPHTEPGQPPLDERVAVVESRVDEQAQSKVEAAHRSPITLNGLVLFNTFENSRAAQYSEPPGAVLTGPDRAGATLNQTLLGFDFNGPGLPGNGRITGSLNLDFFGGLSASSYTLHIRRGVIDFEWKDREVVVGQDKPIISARQPDSLAEVGYPALSYAGNPWLWVPQVRYTEHLHLGDSTGIDAQASLLETSENELYPGRPNLKADPTRPALEGRLNWWTNFSSDRRLELAGGFHVSDSHIIGETVPSRFGTFDWLIKPVKRIQLTGLIAGGENLAVLGGFSDMFSLQPITYRYLPTHQLGGWSQIAISLTPRLTLNLWGGMQAPRTSGLFFGELTHANTYASNMIFRMTPNVLLGAEILQERFGYNNEAHVIGNHYDLSVGYLF